MVQLPAQKLKNKYYLVRAGLNNAEVKGRVSTNPVDKQSRKNTLSSEGSHQVFGVTLDYIYRNNVCDDGCWLWTSTTQNAYETAVIISQDLGLNYSRIVPEFSFMDTRGVGALNEGELDKVGEIIYNNDIQDRFKRPPRGYDGTPNESIEDIFIRMRQTFSIMEAQYRKQEILVISPDSYLLSIFQAAVLGVDLRQHDKYKFRPGEIRELQLQPVLEEQQAVV